MKYFNAAVHIVAMLSLASSLAHAETVSGISTGKTKLEACDLAKTIGTRQCASGNASRFGACNCTPGQFPGGDTWQCQVDITCESAKTKSIER
jgi:hypothetical protein